MEEPRSEHRGFSPRGSGTSDAIRQRQPAPLARTSYVTIRSFGGFFVRMKVVVQAPLHLDTAPSQPAVRWHEVREVMMRVISIHGITIEGEPDMEREVPVPSGFIIPRATLEEKREAALRIFEEFLERRAKCPRGYVPSPPGEIISLAICSTR